MRKHNQQFLRNLEIYAGMGVTIVMDGNRVSPAEAYKVCIMCENMPYMCDYIFEDDKKLAEVHFDRVKEASG